MSADVCEDCGASKPRVHLGDAVVCDRCADKRVAAHTGYPELPEPPPPFTAADAYGRRLTLRFRLWRAPTGIEMELEDADLEPRAGFHLAVLGPHDADVSELEAHLRRRAAEELGRRQLFPNKYRQGWVLADDRDEIAGRLTWSDEGNEVGTPYDVIVDGRTLTWEEIGRALKRDLIVAGVKPGKALERVSVRNAGPGAYVYFDAFLGKNVGDAAYTLAIKTARL